MALATLGTKDNTEIGHHVRSHELGWEAIVVTPQIQGVRVRLMDKTGVAKDAYSFFAYGSYDILATGPIDAGTQAKAVMEAIQTELKEADYRFTDKVEHYNGHPSGVECQEIIRECKDPLIAFAMKHLWRSQWGNKPGAPKVLDLQKTIEYCQLELAREAGEKRL